MIKTLTTLLVTVFLSACCLQKSQQPTPDTTLKPALDAGTDIVATSISYDTYWARAAILVLLACAACAAYYVWKKKP